MKTLAVDFDGVIHQYSKGWQDGSIYDPPIEGAIEGLKELMQNYAVFIHTTRDSRQVKLWLENYGFTVVTESDVIEVGGGIEFWNVESILLVTDRKLPAIAYIDDRAYLFKSWDDVVNSFDTD